MGVSSLVISRRPAASCSLPAHGKLRYTCTGASRSASRGRPTDNSGSTGQAARLGRSASRVSFLPTVHAPLEGSVGGGVPQAAGVVPQMVRMVYTVYSLVLDVGLAACYGTSSRGG